MSMSTPTKITSGYNTSDSEPKERRSKWCRVEGVYRGITADIAIDIKYVNPKLSFS